jgi:hypothetical protein
VALLAGILVACGSAPIGSQAATPIARPSVAGSSSPPSTTSSTSPSASMPPVATGGRWVDAAPAPSRRAEFAAAVLDGRLYVAGGFDALHPGEDLDTVDVYDPAPERWSSVASLPTGGRDHPGLVALGGYLYFVGGEAGAHLVRDVLRYDPGADRWTPVAPLPAPRAQYAAVALASRIYVVGGVSTVAGAGRETWAYDPAADRWITGLAPIPTERNHLAAVAFEGRVWAIGGRVGSNLATVESYDPASDTWRTEPPLALPQGALTAAVVDGRIHVVGGEDLDTFQALKVHQVFDPTTRAWLRGPDLPRPRHGLASGVVDGRWIVVGGGPVADYSATSRVDVFEP